jgi:hypothetical protein
MPPRTCNGRRSRTRGPRTPGSGKLALAGTLAPPWGGSSAADPPCRDHPEFSRWPDVVCGTVPSCNCRSRSAASRSSRSANAKRMRSVLPDPEVEILAARLQSAAFLRSSCTSATISFSGRGGSKRGGHSFDAYFGRIIGSHALSFARTMRRRRAPERHDGHWGLAAGARA